MQASFGRLAVLDSNVQNSRSKCPGFSVCDTIDEASHVSSLLDTLVIRDIRALNYPASAAGFFFPSHRHIQPVS